MTETNTRTNEGRRMGERTEYELNDADFATLMEASRPVPYMIIGGHAPASPQENANRAWAAVGARLGFDHMTVRPVARKGVRFFTAIPTEPTERAS